MLQQAHHAQLWRSLRFTHSNCGSEAYPCSALGCKLDLPGQLHSEASHRGIYCWIDLRCRKDKKRSSSLCVLDCIIPYYLLVLFLHFGQSCICTPQGSILTLLHYKGFKSGADQYLCAYLKPFFPFKMAFVFMVSSSMIKAFEIHL